MSLPVRMGWRVGFFPRKTFYGKRWHKPKKEGHAPIRDSSSARSASRLVGRMASLHSFSCTIFQFPSFLELADHLFRSARIPLLSFLHCDRGAFPRSKPFFPSSSNQEGRGNSWAVKRHCGRQDRLPLFERNPSPHLAQKASAPACP